MNGLSLFVFTLLCIRAAFVIFHLHNPDKHLEHIPHRIFLIRSACISRFNFLHTIIWIVASPVKRVQLNKSAKQVMKLDLITAARLFKWPMTITLSNEVSTNADVTLSGSPVLTNPYGGEK